MIEEIEKLSTYINNNDFESAITLLESLEVINDNCAIYIESLLRSSKVLPKQKERLKVLEKKWRQAERAIKMERLKQQKTGDIKEVRHLLSLFDKVNSDQILIALKECGSQKELVRRGGEFMRKAIENTKSQPTFIKVIEELLKLGVHPETQLTGIHSSSLVTAQRNDMKKIVDLFYKYYPELNPSQQQKPEESKLQPHSLSVHEKSFLEAKESINDWENASEMEQVMKRFKKCTQAVDLDYYFYAVLYGFHKDGHQNAYLDQEVQGADYKRWCKSNTASGLLEAGVLESGEFSINQISKYINLDNRQERIERKGYYTYLIEQEEVEDSFEDHVIKYGNTFNINEKATAIEIKQFEKLANVLLPTELKEFYTRIGSLSLSERFGILSIKEFTKALKESNSSKLHSLGLIDMILYYWGGDKPEFNSGVYLSKDDIDFLNENYTTIGYLREDDNAMYVLYYDKEERFGAVYHNQDNDVVFKEYLFPMLKGSIAKRTFHEIIVTALAEGSIESMLGDWYFGTFSDWKKII